MYVILFLNVGDMSFMRTVLFDNFIEWCIDNPEMMDRDTVEFRALAVKANEPGRTKISFITFREGTVLPVRITIDNDPEVDSDEEEPEDD